MRKQFLLLAILFASSMVFAQQRVNGLVEDEETGTPVPFATVADNAGSYTVSADSNGKFILRVGKKLKAKDSLRISAIGFKPRSVSVSDLIINSRILLERSLKELENVIVVSTIKGDPSQFVYYRSWNEKGGGGEIGQIIQLPRKGLRLKAVHIKVNQNYDTCWLKLHVRMIGKRISDKTTARNPEGIWGRLPEEELLTDDIIIPATIKFGLLEFDLSDKNIKLPSDAMYIGFEVLSCSKPTSSPPSFFFMGNEAGENIYRDKAGTEWDYSSQYTIYIRLLLQ